MSDWQEIVQQRPKDIDEAIPALRKALEYYHFGRRLLRKRRFGRIEIEGIGGMSAVRSRTAARLKEAVQPF